MEKTKYTLFTEQHYFERIITIYNDRVSAVPLGAHVSLAIYSSLFLF